MHRFVFKLAWVANASIPRSYFYTNAVVAGTNNAVFASNWKYFMGNSFSCYNCYLREIIVYTNALTQAQLSSIHNYATNTYGYSP